MSDTYPEYFLGLGVVHLVDKDAGSLTPRPKHAAPRHLRPPTVLHQVPVHVCPGQVEEVSATQTGNSTLVFIKYHVANLQ